VSPRARAGGAFPTGRRVPGRGSALTTSFVILTLAAATLPAQQALPDRANGPTRSAADPRFDWFRYEGRDSVYQVHRARRGEYYNPILAGFYSDPSIVGVNGDYYLVTSTFSYFPGIPVFHSRDLVSWTQIGNVLTRPAQLELDTIGISRGVFAPAISYHDGLFYVINTLVDAGGNFFVTARNPAGPWSDPFWLRFDGIDPSFFFDDDGKAYVVNNGAPVGRPLYNGHRAIWIQQFDVAAQQLVGPRSVIVNGGVDITKQPIWIEGPHLFKANGRGRHRLRPLRGGLPQRQGHRTVRAVRAQSDPHPAPPGP
jgi:alpha-N-arabinofuranosidase